MGWLPTTAGVDCGAAVEDAVALGGAIVGVGGPDCAGEDDGDSTANGEAVCALEVLRGVDGGDVPATVGDELAVG